MHDWLANHAYWARGIPHEVFERSLEGSLCVGVYRGSEQLAFCRLISDHATFAYLADVFVRQDERRRGLAGWMLQALRTAPKLAGIRRWLLGTRDAHALYAASGFAPLATPERFMEVLTPYPSKP